MSVHGLFHGHILARRALVESRIPLPNNFHLADENFYNFLEELKEMVVCRVLVDYYRLD